MDKKDLTIYSVGDLMICDSPLYVSVGFGSKYPEIKGKLLKTFKDIFDDGDVVIGNFETVVYPPKNKSLKELQMACSEDVIYELKNSGFSILNLANNHSMQHGIEGFERTRKVCENSGIKSIGNKNEAPFIQEINGVKIAFFALCIHLEWYQPNNILYEDDIADIINSVKELHETDSDIVIVVSVHWGDEFAEYPSNAQVALAHKLVDFGANIILGHHPHVYQGIEEYHKAVICYSQGNFVSDMKADLCQQTAVLKFAINPGKKITWQLVPYYIDSNYVIQKNDSSWFTQRQFELSKVLDGKISDDDYWHMVTVNHAKVHQIFKNFFTKNFFKYKPLISIRMIFEFLVRKFKKIFGISTFGRVSSMDPHIRKILEKYNIQ